MRWSLRAQLILLMAALVLCLTVALGWLAFRAATAVVESEALRGIGFAATAYRHRFRELVMRYHERGRAVLRLLETACGHEAPAPACARRLLAEFATVEGAATVAFAPPRGGPVVVGDPARVLDLPRPADDQLAALGTDPTGERYLLLQVKARSGGRLALRVGVERVEWVFREREGLGASGDAFLVDARGRTLTRRRGAPPDEAGPPPASAPWGRCLAGEDGEALGRDARGVPVVVAFRHLPEAGGACLVAQIDQAEALAPLARLRGELGLIIALFAAAAFAGALLVARRVAGPIRELTRRTRSLRAGDLESPVPVRGAAEVRVLGETLAAMAASLEEARRVASASQRRVAFLAEASAVLASSLEPASTLASVAELAVPFVADLCVVDLLAEDGRIERVAVAHAVPEHAPLADELRRRYPPDPAGQHPVARVLRTGLPELAPDVSEALLEAIAPEPGHRAIARRLGYRSYVVVPLVARGRTLGAISFVTGPSGHRYTTEDCAFAEEIARRAALAIDNARLFVESEARRREAEALADVGRLLSETLDLQAVARRVIERVAALVGASHAVLYRLDVSGDLVLLAATGHGVDWQPRLPAGTATVGLAVRERRPIVTDDMLADPRITFDPATRARLERADYRAVVAVPLLVQDRVIGALGVGDRPGRRFSAEDVRLLRAFAHQAAVAVENARLYTEERAARLEAELANRAKDEFLAVLSHELRTPLTAMLGWVRMLRTGRVPPEQTERALEVIERNTRVQSQIINDLLDVSRIVAGKLQLERRPVDLAAVVEEGVEALRRDAEARALRLDVALDPDVGCVLGDPVRLQQVVVNLVANAVKFTPPGGRIEVRLERRGAGARLTVRDTGVGIDPRLLPHIFDRFRQADSTSVRGHEGLGLGLAIVRHLVELHGGTVRADSEGRGKGARFTVEWPLVSAERAAGARPADPPRSTGAERDRRLAGLRVLLVDDHADARELLGAALERYGAAVVVAPSAAEALRRLETTEFDVLVSDIGMPGEDGYALIARLREHERTRGRHPLPAVALTAYASLEDHRRALAAGFHLHVAKPVDPQTLAEVVARAARRREGRDSPVAESPM